MITTSDAYREAIAAATETTRFEADFGFVPEGAAEGATVSSTSSAEISRLYQLCDGVKNMSARWASLGLGGWGLDGTFTVAPRDLLTEDVDYQVGHWDNSISDENGVLQDPLIIEYTMDSEYDLVGCTVFFDDDGWGTHVTVRFYSAALSLVAEKSVWNDGPVLSVSLPASGVKLIEVSIREWSSPLAHPRAAEIVPGQIFLFTPKNTFSIDFTETITPFDTALRPTELTISFDNSERQFDIVNPAGLMAFLRKRMKVSARMGLLVGGAYEYVQLGNLYVADWPDDTQEDEAQLVCQPYIVFGTSYYTHAGRSTQTVAEAASRIFDLAGVRDEHRIDDALADIPVNQYIGERVPLISALGQLAVAAGGYWKFERDGSYSLKAWSLPPTSAAITYDAAYEKPKIRQPRGGLVSTVNCKHFVWSAADGQLDDFDNLVSTGEEEGGLRELHSAFVPSADRATAIAWLALDYFNLRLDYRSSYRGDPAIEAGDVVEVENDYANSEVLATSAGLTWDAQNKLSGEIEGKGAG